jgi:threonine dehydrogenase-like Zn-dependent dehydrogenase
MSLTTKALILYAEEISDNGKRYKNPSVTVQSRELKNNLKHDEIRIKHIFVGLCGTDIHMLLARSGETLQIDAVDNIISQTQSIQGIRDHLGGAFDRMIGLVKSDKLPLYLAVTNIINGIENTKELLTQNEHIEQTACKILVRLNR